MKRHPAAHREPIYLYELYDPQNKLISNQTFITRQEDGQIFLNAVIHFRADLDECIKFLHALCDILNVPTT